MDIINDIKDIDRRSLIGGETRLDDRYYGQLQHAMAKMIDGNILNTAVTTLIDTTNLALLFRSALKETTDSLGDFFLGGGQVFSEAALREMSTMKPLEIISRLEETDYALFAQDMVKLYEKTGMIDAVDRIIEKQKFRLLQELLSPRVLSPCNLFWYLILKEYEIRNLRLLLKATFDGVSPSETRDYLVMA